MLKGNRRVRPSEPQDESATETQRARVLRALLAGAVVGGITGFLGVGGGFLVVPALIAFARRGLREAIGTSLLVIAINSAAGFAGHVGAGRLDFGLVGALTIAAVLGAVAGERIARMAAAPSHRENPTAGGHGCGAPAGTHCRLERNGLAEAKRASSGNRHEPHGSIVRKAPD